mmetsp:Transcript_38055/g.122179  ORF Transcript_38055/g.122179 Transcript_38055/m.122179 type:complete len:538 (+) Transcript_38055:2-1615(+)
MNRRWVCLWLSVVVWGPSCALSPPSTARTLPERTPKQVAQRVRRVSRGQVPTIAIIGRPNVGKSTLTNRLCDAGQTNGAIVFDEPGVTRDRIYQHATWEGRDFDVVDTGGLLFDDSDGLFAEEIREQAQVALAESCAAVLVVDGREGRTRIDEQIAEFLRKQRKRNFRTVVAVNKCENHRTEVSLAADFWCLGLGEPMACSGIHGNGVAEVLDELLPSIDDAWEAVAAKAEKEKHESSGGALVSSSSSVKVEEDDPQIDVAFLGRPNVGKSSLLNRFLGQPRSIVSSTPGTTRDAVDESVTVDDRTFRFVDTAGVRRKTRVTKAGPEEKMVGRALLAVKRADVVLLVLDSTVEPTDQDAALARRIKQDGRACVILANKWDIKDDKDEASTRIAAKSIRESLSDVAWADILFVSAETGQRCLRVYGAVETAVKNHRKRVPTNVVNEVIRDALLWQQPPASSSGGAGKIYFASQTGIAPPTIVAMCNDPKLFTDNYKRYLERKLRESLDWTGTPIRLIFRAKRLRDELRDRRRPGGRRK